MIYLYQNQYTNASGSCSRNSTMVDPYYMWNMEHKLSGEIFNFIPYRIPPTTNYKPGYDVFNIGIFDNIPESLTGDTMTGQTNVHLIPGEYFLKVYQQMSGNTLQPTTEENVVFQTLVNVVGTNQNIPVSYQGEDDIFIIYNSDND